MIMILGKKTLKSVENKFFNYQKIKDAIIDARAEQDSKGGFTDGDNGHSRVSDPTAIAALKHITPLHYVTIKDGLWDIKFYNPEKWISIIEYCFGVYNNSLTGELAKRRYIKHETPEFTMGEMRISSKNTYYSWRDDIAMMAVMLAVGEGIIDPTTVTE